MLSGHRVGRFAFLLGPITGITLFAHNRYWIWLVLGYVLVLAAILAIHWPHQKWKDVGELPHLQRIGARCEVGLISTLIVLPMTAAVFYLAAESLPLAILDQSGRLLDEANRPAEVSRMVRRFTVTSTDTSPAYPEKLYVARLSETTVEGAPGKYLVRMVVRPYIDGANSLVGWVLALICMIGAGLFFMEHLSVAWIRDFSRNADQGAHSGQR